MTPSFPRTGRRPGPVGLLSALGGLALFWYFVRQAGVGEVLDGIRSLGWAMIGVLVLSGLRFVVRTLAWMRCMPAGHGLRVREVLAAFLAGDAVGNLTPLSLVVGEPVKAFYLRDRASLGRTLPALAVETLFYTLSVVMVVAAGGVALFLLVRPPAADGLVTAVPLATLAVLVVAGHWLIWRQTPIASGALRWLGRLGLAPALIGRIAARVHDVEARVHRDYPRDGARLVAVAALELTFHLLAIVEIYLVLALISDRPPTVIDAFVFEAANRFINVVFKFVPLRIGVDEAGTALFADLLAYGTTAGVTMAVVRKARMLVWTAVGVAALVRRGLSLTELTASRPRQAVVVMARAPDGPRAPKRRLSDAIPSESDRRRLYGAFLADTVAACRALPHVSLRVAYAPDGGTDGFRAAGVADAELVAQRGDDLGPRERHVFEDLFAAGFATVVIIGSDLPTLPLTHVTDALERVDEGSVVLGPADDGGYYLLGLGAPPDGAPVPDLFSGIRWGTASARDDTVRAAARAGLAVREVDAWYDVDDADTLARLRHDLADAACAERAPATARVLRALTHAD